MADTKSQKGYAGNRNDKGKCGVCFKHKAT